MNRNPENSKVVAFLDLETTGSEPTDRIIEVGLVLVDRDLNVITDYSAVVKPIKWDWLRDMMPQRVHDMHTLNGLLNDVDTFGRDILDVDAEVAALLAEHHGSAHVPLGGSGVSHFDLRYIRAEMRQTASHLAYWAYDTGVLRRWFKWWGIEVRDAAMAGDEKTHRALDDAYASLHEAKAFRDFMLEQGHKCDVLEELLTSYQ
jgi:oligoribonuclease (3'-5' exoribonuclease)